MALITYADKSTMNANANVPAVNKVQASDMNEIKSVVNLNARKDIMTIKLTSNYTLTSTNTTENVVGFSLYSSIGDKLTFANNKIVVGSGVKKVLVSYGARTHAKTGSTTRMFTYLVCNDNSLLTVAAISQEKSGYITNGDEYNVERPPMLIPVVAGSKFGLTCYGEAGAYIMSNTPLYGSFNWTYITVEVVEYE